MKRGFFLITIILILALLEATFSSYFFVLAFSLFLFHFGLERLSLFSLFGGGVVLDLFGVGQFGLANLYFFVIFIFLFFLKMLIPKGSVFLLISFFLAVSLFLIFSGFGFPWSLANLKSLEPSFILSVYFKNVVVFLILFPVAVFVYELFKENKF